MAAVKKKAPTKKRATKKAAATRARAKSTGALEKPRIFTMPFASVYPLYVQKVEKKGRTKLDVDEVIACLTGYRGEGLQRRSTPRSTSRRSLPRPPR